MTAAQKTATTLETQASTAQSGAKDVGQKAMGFAEQNIANSFEFAQKLVRAKDIQEVMALQQEYLQSQMKAFSEQAKDLGSTATKAAINRAVLVALSAALRLGSSSKRLIGGRARTPLRRR